MIRALTEYALPLLLPTALYILYLVWRKRRGDAPPPNKHAMLWPMLLLLGAVLAIGMGGVLSLKEGGQPGSQYTPAHMENGRVAPGRIQ